MRNNCALLLFFHKALLSTLEEQLGLVDRVAKSRSFVPHITVAFRDLSKSNFRKAWSVYQEKQFDYHSLKKE